jgi:hypothetical protein
MNFYLDGKHPRERYGKPSQEVINKSRRKKIRQLAPLAEAEYEKSEKGSIPEDSKKKPIKKKKLKSKDVY